MLNGVCGVWISVVVEVVKVCVLWFSAVCVVQDDHNVALQKRKIRPVI